MRAFDVQQIEDWLTAGMNTSELAARLGVDRGTIYYRKVNDPEMRGAFERAEVRRRQDKGQLILDLLEEMRSDLALLKQEIIAA